MSLYDDLGFTDYELYDIVPKGFDPKFVASYVKDHQRRQKIMMSHERNKEIGNKQKVGENK